MQAFEPSDEHRRTVRALAGFGIRQDDIAIHLGIDPKTLRRHFREELDRGVIEANAKVAQSLFHLATVDKNVSAAIFWLKARAGWREKVSVEHTGADGTAVLPAAVIHLSIGGDPVTDTPASNATLVEADEEAGSLIAHEGSEPN